MEEKLSTHKDFLESHAQDFIEEIKETLFMGINHDFLKQIKYIKDLNTYELAAFNLFKEKCFKSLKSRNKSSAETKHNRKIFFETKRIYHHHLIDLATYNNEIIGKDDKEKDIKINSETKTIKDRIVKGYHTSGLCLHYQIIQEKETIFYKVLFISIHPDGDEWTTTKDVIENGNLYQTTLTNLGEKNEK